MARTTAIDGYECFDSEGSLALQIGDDDVLHLRRVSPEGSAHRLTDEQHQAVNDAVLAALGLDENPLLNALRAVLPFAESRAEDMIEAADESEEERRECAKIDRELADKAVAAVDAAKALLASLEGETAATQAASWRAEGKPDPHGDRYDVERAKLMGGHLTDDQVAHQTAMLGRNDLNFEPVLAVARDRIRWLSRALVKATEGRTDA